MTEKPLFVRLGDESQAARDLMLREGDPAELKYFFVAFLDLLGQREQLRKLKAVPGDLRPDDNTSQALKATLGVVHRFRSTFVEFFKADHAESEFSRSLPREQREELRRLTRSDIIHYGFSDSFVVAVSLKGAHDDPTPINGVWSALYASCGVACISLAARHAVRGAVDVGWGVQISGNEIYGSALERAYTLESRCAEYPRIFVGEELLAYLDEIAGRSSTVGMRAAALRAESAKRLIFRDADGAATLDYWGSEFRSIVPVNATVKAVQAAYDFVRAEHGRMIATGNARLAERYARLRAYFELRVPSWGING